VLVRRYAFFFVLHCVSTGSPFGEGPRSVVIAADGRDFTSGYDITRWRSPGKP
jgi:hypothetical protein